MSRVLVVDDDVMLLKMTEQLLKSEYSVMLAKSGEEAISAITYGPRPDIILLDIDMPKMDGYATLRKIQELDPDIPVIFLTGLTETEYELKGLTAGAVDYITKPFVKEILLARLRIHLSMGRRKENLDPEKVESLSAVLNDTEMAIAKLMAQGYTNAEIAEQLHYSYNYIKKVSSIIYNKLGISRRNEIRDFLM